MTTRFQGIFTALVTPFKKDGSVDVTAISTLVERQIQAGIQGIVACGSTGETATLEDFEQIQIVQTCLDVAKGRIPIIAGAGNNQTKRACQLQRNMSELGVAATMHVLPWYNKPTQEGLYRHFRAVAESSNTPVILYNVPSRTGVDLEAKTLLRLAQDCPIIVGLKETNLEPVRMQSSIMALKQIRSDFSFLSGEDGFLLPLLAMGGDGLISVGSNLVPKMFVDLQANFASGDLSKARELAGQLAHLTSLMFFRTNPIPAKTALAKLGLAEESFRLPLCELSSEDGEFLAQGLRKLNIL
jgi:4-hydroxy-tetrahydrodipicolinate synthase